MLQQSIGPSLWQAPPTLLEIQSFPAEIGVTQYRYVVLGDQTVLVKNSRKIVELIR